MPHHVFCSTYVSGGSILVFCSAGGSLACVQAFGTMSLPDLLRSTRGPQIAGTHASGRAGQHLQSFDSVF